MAGDGRAREEQQVCAQPRADPHSSVRPRQQVEQVEAVEIPVRRPPPQAAPTTSQPSSSLSSDHDQLVASPERVTEPLFPSGATTPLTIALQEAHDQARPPWLTYGQWLTVLSTAERSLPMDSDVEAESLLPWLVASLRCEEPAAATDSRHRALEFLPPASIAFLQQVDELLLVYRWTYAAAGPTPSENELARAVGISSRPRTDPTPAAATPRTPSGPPLRPRRATSTRPSRR